MKFIIALIFYLSFAAFAHAAITDIKFGQFQIADTQWNVSACLNTTTCEIYSKNPGTAFKIPWTSGQVQWASGDYVQLELSGDPNFPYIARQYTSNGTLKETLGMGKIVNMGPDYFFFVGSDNNTGQLFSGSSGMSDTSGVTWTGTLNPTLAEADALASNYSETPLAPGETVTQQQQQVDPIFESGISAPQQTRKNTRLGSFNGNSADITIQGNNNTVELEQRGAGHYLELDILGNSNTVTSQQLDQTGIVRHYQETTVQGDSNTVTILQSGSSKTSFITILGSTNQIDIAQTGSGAHFLDLQVNGNNHSVDILQDGSGDHAATIDLTEWDGSWTFKLEQKGSTPQVYSLPHNLTDGTIEAGACYSISGCTLEIFQQ